MTRRLSVKDSASFPVMEGDQTYEILCACGQMMSGHRQVQSQSPACPHCGKPVFVLPADCRASAAPARSRQALTPAAARSPGGVIDKLNRLAFWTKLRKSRASMGSRLSSLATRAGRWIKRRFTSRRG
jgi:hypothetical protein